MGQRRIGEGRALHGGKAEVELGNGIVAEAAGAEVGHALRHAVHAVVERFLEEAVGPFVEGKHAFAYTLAGALLVGQFLFLHLDAHAATEPLDGFGICHLFEFHEEAHRIAAFAAGEAFAHLAGGRNGERGRLFVVERTEPLVVRARLAERDELFHHIDDVCGVQNALYGILVNHGQAQAAQVMGLCLRFSLLRY